VFGELYVGKQSPVVQIPPVGGPPRRSADKTPEPPPAVRTKNLQVASSTRAANARNKPVVQVLVAVKRVRNLSFHI
jgi:hypothetical protein